MPLKIIAALSLPINGVFLKEKSLSYSHSSSSKHFLILAASWSNPKQHAKASLSVVNIPTRETDFSCTPPSQGRHLNPLNVSNTGYVYDTVDVFAFFFSLGNTSLVPSTLGSNFRLVVFCLFDSSILFYVTFQLAMQFNNFNYR
mmetsp:Transcript_59324/g.67167  ORF Transcript_59324/g.67167 Transcript_59324/m.67167 type:complete len:144 (-) Transcript_59324:79-510(-)